MGIYWIANSVFGMAREYVLSTVYKKQLDKEDAERQERRTAREKELEAKRLETERLKAEGVQRKLVGFKMIDRGIPRHGYTLATTEGEAMGVVPSGPRSPWLQTGLGLGSVAAACATPGTVIGVLIRDRLLRAEVVKVPFV